MKLLAGIVILILLIISTGLLLEVERRDYNLAFTDSVNVRLQREIESRELEAQDAWRKAQCYKEECVRLAFEYMSDTVYTLPCNGRQIEIGGR